MIAKRVVGGAAVFGLALLASYNAAIGQQAFPKPPMPLEIFGLPLGTGPDEVRKLTTDRGYIKYANGYTRVPRKGEGNYIERTGQIGDFVDTRFLTQIAALKFMGANHFESFRFFFLAPPNENVSFGGGIYQSFGGNAGPIAASPLTTEVMKALVAKYGQPGYGNAETRQYGWFRGPSGQPITGPAAWECVVATVQAVGSDIYASTNSANATVSNTQAIARAQKSGCVAGFVADIGNSNGYVTTFQTRVIDFRVAAIGAVRTGQHVLKLKAGSDADRAKRNRPDF